MQPIHDPVNVKTISLMLTHAIDSKARVGMSTWKVTRAGGEKMKSPYMEHHGERGSKEMQSIPHDPFFQPKGRYVNNQAHKPPMDGNLRHIIPIMVFIICIMLYGHQKVMIRRKGRLMTWGDTTSRLLMMIILRCEKRFLSTRRFEESVEVQLNYNPNIVKRDKGPIDIIIISVIDRVLTKTIPMNLPFSFFNM